MKLRLENGNFKIKQTHDAETNTDKYDPLPTGLKPIDFIGSVICYSEPEIDFFDIVVNASTNVDGYPHVVDLHYLDGTSATLYYNSLNGKVGRTIDDVLDDDSSGSDGGSGVIIH